MKICKENFIKKRKKLIAKCIKYFDEHPKIEIAYDFVDEIFQKLMIGYILIAGFLFFLLWWVSYYTLPNEIKNTFSPVISVTLTAIVIPFFLNIYNRKKENEAKQFENNRDMYLAVTRILLPVVVNKTFNTEDKEAFLDYVDENRAEITIAFSSNMIATINSIINSCDDNDNQKVLYYSKKLVKQIRKEIGNKKFSLELLDTSKNRDLIKK